MLKIGFGLMKNYCAFVIGRQVVGLGVDCVWIMRVVGIEFFDQ